MTVIEFAIVAPVFLTLLIGAGDLAQMVYAQSVLNGAVEQAARRSSLETADTTVADATVAEIVSSVLPDAEIRSNRISYFDFADVGRAESLNDANGNGDCDNGETYLDENSNGDWDSDIGVDGNGGSGDVVIYTVEADFVPVFRIPFLPDTWTQRTLTATAVRKNQPYGIQAGYSSQPGTCA